MRCLLLDRAAAITLLSAAALIFGAGCHPTARTGQGTAPERGKLITRAQIRESGARNAWEAVRGTGTFLSARENGNGEPVALTRRGRGSLVLSAAPLVFVDGAQTSSFQQLRTIPATSIESIRIFSGVQGTLYFGTGGGNGVVVVETRMTPDP